MSKQYFQKESQSSRFIVSSTGKPVQFETLGGNQGVIVLDDAIPEQKVIADALTKSIGARGIVKLTEGEYRAKKTQFPYNASAASLKRQANQVAAFPSADQFNPQRKPGVVAATRPKMPPAPRKLTQASIQAAEKAMQGAEVKTATTPDALSAAFKPATGRAKRTPPAEAQVAVTSNV